MKFVLAIIFAVVQADYFILEMDKPDINKASLVPRALTDIITCRDKCEKDESCRGVNIDLKSLEACKVVTEAAAIESNARTMRGRLVEAPACESSTTGPDEETTSPTTTPFSSQ